MPFQKPHTNFELRFYQEVFGLDDLHFGLWESSAPLTVENLRTAQDRYNELLLSLVPPEAGRILDVGCGTGVLADKLCRLGKSPICLSPDVHHRRAVQARRPDLPFRLSRFEDFHADETFELIIMSESAQYLRLGEAAVKCNELLKPGGWLLVSDYFRRRPLNYYKWCHVYDDFLQAFQELRFTLTKRFDITEKVLPTLELGAMVYNRFGLPAIKIGKDFVLEKYPKAGRLMRWILRKEIQKVVRIMGLIVSNTDTERFRKEMIYCVLLLQKPQAGAARIR